MHLFNFLIKHGALRIVKISHNHFFFSPIFLGSVFLEKEQDVHEAFQLGVKTLKARQLLNETTIEFDIQYASPQDFFHLYIRGKKIEH